jgi:integrase
MQQPSSPTWPEACQAWYAHLTLERGRRPRTILAYKQVLTDFGAWLAKTPWWEIEPSHVRAYLDRPQRVLSARPGQPLAPASRALYSTTLSHFYAWAARAGLLQQDPLRNFTPEKWPAPIPRALDPAEVARLLDHVADDPRVEAIVWCGFGLGLRAGEVAAARVEHLQLHGGRPAIIVHGKGGRRRRIPLPDPVREVLARYLAGRRTGPVIEHARKPGHHVSSRTVSRMVGWAMAEVGLVGGNHHQLRHTFATSLLEAGRGQNLYSVSRLMGHSSTTITEQTYSAYLGDVDAVMSLVRDPRMVAHA